MPSDIHIEADEIVSRQINISLRLASHLVGPYVGMPNGVVLRIVGENDVAACLRSLCRFRAKTMLKNEPLPDGYTYTSADPDTLKAAHGKALGDWLVWPSVTANAARGRKP